MASFLPALGNLGAGEQLQFHWVGSVLDLLLTRSEITESTLPTTQFNLRIFINILIEG